LSIADRLTGALYRRRPPFPWNLLSLLLAPIGCAYGWIMRLRAWVYGRGWLTVHRPACRVVSVGNLTMGGTGKTPLTIFLAGKLKEQGRRVAVVSRGYRGAHRGETAVVSTGDRVLLDAAQAGDEPFLLAHRLPGVPVIVGARRAAAVARAVDDFRAEIVVCDDAFSHLALARNVNLAVVHGRDGLGNRRVAPAGPLREPPRALRRADAVILNVTYGDEPAVLDDLRRADYAGPVLKVRYAPPRLIRWPDRTPLEPERMADRRLVAFAATARPDDFFAALRDAGWELPVTRRFSDHHAYTPGDLESLAELAAARGICYLAATEKDAVKLPAALPGGVELLVAAIELQGEGEALARLLTLVDPGAAEPAFSEKTNPRGRTDV